MPLQHFIRRATASPFIRGVTVLASGNIVAQIIPILMMPFFARMFAAEMFGVQALLTIGVTFIVPIATGFYEYAIPTPRSTRHARGLATIAFTLSFALNLTLFTLITLFHSQIAALFHIEDIGHWIYAYPVVAFSASMLNISNYWMLRHGKFHLQSLNKICQATSVAVIAMLMGLFHINDGLIAGFVLGLTCTGLFAFTQALRHGLRLDYRLSSTSPPLEGEPNSQRGFGGGGNAATLTTLEAKGTTATPHQNARAFWLPLKGGAKRKWAYYAYLIRKYAEFPIFGSIPSSINNLAAQVPVIIITAHYSLAMTGHYSVVRNLMSAAMNVAAACIGQVILKHFTDMIHARKPLWPYYRTLAMWILLCGATVMAGTLLIGPWFFQLYLGKGWEDSVSIVRTLAICLPFWLLGPALAHAAIAIKKLRAIALWQVMHGLMAFGLGLFSDLPFHDFIWRVVAYEAFSYTLYFLIMSAVVRRYDQKALHA